VGIEVVAVGAGRWADVEALFGTGGNPSGCWCMWWRLPGGEFRQNKSAGNKAAFETVVKAGGTVGLLAYVDGQPAGWMAIAPREVFTRLLRSPLLKGEDAAEPGVWAINCFFIHKDFRGSGVAKALLKAAPAFAKKHGAKVLEAYPVDTRERKEVSAADAFTGTQKMFVGFKKRSAKGRRLVVRRPL
jgi:GNAT superfamily N-acetyltransferase